MNAYLPHEKLNVYSEALSFVRTMMPLVETWPRIHAVCDQMERAGESVLSNLAKAARHRRTDKGIYYLECSLGSILECAACLDVALVKGLINEPQVQTGKKSLQCVARMEVGLRKSWGGAVREEDDHYETLTHVLFPHESLVLYRKSLDLYRRLEASVLTTENRRLRHFARIDEMATSLVLNIAEGNGRFSRLDHGKFITIAEDSATMLGVYLDLAASCCATDIEPVKALLREIAAMLAGLKGYLLESETPTH
jgi:four helix bundle protein